MKHNLAPFTNTLAHCIVSQPMDEEGAGNSSDGSISSFAATTVQITIISLTLLFEKTF